MNSNLKDVQISGIRKFYNEVQKYPNAISLTLGQPDFATPDKVKEAMIEAINTNKTVYTANAGLMELREEISKYLNNLDIKYDPNNICITVGGSEALFTVFTALIDKGETVLIPTPAYPAYESIVTILGGKIVNYSLKDDFTIDLDELESKIVKYKPKYIVLSLPSNPTGAILSKDQRDGLVDILDKNDVIAITDEIYEALCFDEYYSVAQNEKILDKIIYIGGFSKMFSMTGLRVGYFACRDNLYSELMKVHQYNVSCATSICQYGAYVGLRDSLHSVQDMKVVFNNRRDYVVNRLKDMGIDVVEPKGAFYVFPSIKKFGLSSEEFCHRLLKEGNVACVPGNAFGDGGEGYFRISYCYSDEELKKAMDYIEKFIEKIAIL